METLLYNNTDRVHRLAYDLDDYELAYSAQFATDDTIIKWDNYPLYSYDTMPFDEYLVIIEADKPVNYEALVGFYVYLTGAGNDTLSISSGKLAYLPQRTTGSSDFDRQTVYYGDWVANKKIGFQYDYDIMDGTNTVPAYVTAYDTAEITGTAALIFRESKSSSFSAFKMRGEYFSLKIAEYDSTQSTCSVKVYKKNLIAGV